MEHAAGVARHQHDRQGGPPSLRLLRELGAAHAGAERDVREQQVERLHAVVRRKFPLAPTLF